MITRMMLVIAISIVHFFSIYAMELTIDSIVAKDITHSESDKTIRFGAFVKPVNSKQLCYAWAEQTLAVPHSVLTAFGLIHGRVFSHTNGLKNLTFTEAEMLFMRLSALHYSQLECAEKKRDDELDTDTETD